MHHLSYTKLHCLTNNPTRFGSRRRHSQGVPSKLLNIPTCQKAVNTCITVHCGTAASTPTHNFYNDQNLKSGCHLKYINLSIINVPQYKLSTSGLGRSVRIATGYGLDDPGIESL